MSFKSIIISSSRMMDMTHTCSRSTLKGHGQLCILYFVEITLWAGFFNSSLGLIKTQKCTILEVVARKLSQVHKLVMVEICEDEIPKKTHIYFFYVRRKIKFWNFLITFCFKEKSAS